MKEPVPQPVIDPEQAHEAAMLAARAAQDCAVARRTNPEKAAQAVAKAYLDARKKLSSGAA